VIKKILAFTAIFAFFIATATQGLAYSYKVKGYTKKNGTYVNSYYRTSPNYYKTDNYTYKPSQPTYNKAYTTPRSNYTYSSGWSTPSYYSTPSSYSNSTYKTKPYSSWNAGYQYNYGN